MTEQHDTENTQIHPVTAERAYRTWRAQRSKAIDSCTPAITVAQACLSSVCAETFRPSVRNRLSTPPHSSCGAHAALI